MIRPSFLGKLQVYLGISFLFMSLILGVYIFKFIFIGTVATGASAIATEWDNFCKANNCSQIPVAPHVISDIVLLGAPIRALIYILVILVFVLIILSINMILGGLRNKRQ